MKKTKNPDLVTPGFVLCGLWFFRPLTANRCHLGGLRPLSA
jgi:hypothetical protein